MKQNYNSNETAKPVILERLTNVKLLRNLCLALVLTFSTFSISQGKGLLTNFSWNSSNLMAGATGVTYTFSYTITTADPYFVFYGLQNSPSGWNTTPLGTPSISTSDVSITINGTPATIDNTASDSYNYGMGFFIRLANPALATAGANIVIIANNVTNYATPGTYTWQWIRTAVGAGQAIDSIANPTSIVLTAPAPIAPVAIAATGNTTTGFNANWNAAANATDYYLDVSLYNTFSSMVSGYNNLSVGNVTTEAITGLTSNTQYYYRVRAYNTTGTSANSNIISTQTALVPPTALAATSITTTGFTAYWNIGSLPNDVVDVSTNSNFTSFVPGYHNAVVNAMFGVTTETVSGLNCSSTYYYRVRDYNGGSSAIDTSAYSNTITVNLYGSGDSTATACTSLKWYGTTYTQSGMPTHQLTTTHGCDSTVTLMLTINQPSTGDTAATACNNFKWYGTTYTQTGTPTHILTNKKGCDSTVTLNLTINAATTGDTTVLACVSFEWYGTTYTQSGTPTHILTNKKGCDSTVTLNLTITTCTGIPEINSDSHLLIYPNPSASNITIECPQQGIIEMYNMEGQLVNNITTTGNKTNIDVSALPIGMYVITVKTENGISRQKFIKE